MKIKQELLDRWIPEQRRRGIKSISAWEAVTKEYCNKMSMFDVCPMNCRMCENRVKEMFDLDWANSPYAGLIINARKALAEARDETLLRPEPVSDAGNHFIHLAETL